jgi:hypothetical protein
MARGLSTRMRATPERSASVRIAYTLPGWPLVKSRETDTGLDRSFFAYNRRGQRTLVKDPTAQGTWHEYNLFGELESVFKPHHEGPTDTFFYDHLGRLEIRTRAHRVDRPVESILYEYDAQTGDPIRERWLKPGPPLTGDPVLIERTFDDLGRLVQSTDYNLGLVALGFDAAYIAVDREFAYDLAGRRTLEAVGIAGQWLDVWTSFDLNPATGGWRRTTHYPQALASMVTHDFDGLGRLARVQGYTDSHDFDTHLHWRGDLYSGRTQHFSAAADPFRELAAFDDLGQRNAWTYTAVDTDTSGFPFDMAWGERYCGGKWTHECSRPLYHQSAVRDVMGRVASLSWHFGHPADHGGTGITTPRKDSLTSPPEK